MYKVAFHPAGKRLWDTCTTVDSYRQEGSGNKDILLAKNGLGWQGTLFQEMTGVYQADDLTNNDQVIPDCLV